MTLAAAGEIVAGARAAGGGVGAFNVIGVEHAEAVVAGAEDAGTPVLLQISENAARFHGGAVTPLAAAARELAAAARVPGWPTIPPWWTRASTSRPRGRPPERWWHGSPAS